MQFSTLLFIPYAFHTKVAGPHMGTKPITNSSSLAQLTLEDDDENRVSSATVTISVTRPDTQVKTVTALSVPMIGNGVYQVGLPKTAYPKALYNYKIEWNILIDTDEFNLVDYIDVWQR